MFQRYISAALIAVCFLGSFATAGQNVVVVVDDSGSMADKMRSGTRRIAAAKQALNTVLSSLPDDAKVGVLALNSGWIMPLGELDRSQTQNRINELRAQGGTLLGANMRTAVDSLLQLREEQVYGDYRLLVVTDGEANDQDELEYVLPDIMTRGLTVDVIGVDMKSDHSLATRVHNYRRADDAASLETAIAESLAESDDSMAIGGENDFELLEGLPSDLAMSVITALSTAENEPVASTNYNPAEYSFGPVGYQEPVQSSGGRAAMFGGFFVMGLIFFAVVTMRSLLRAGRAGRR